MKQLSISQTAELLVRRLNENNLGAYIGSVTSVGNYVVRFNNPKIPSILVAESHLNEHYAYRYNLTKRQKTLLREKDKRVKHWCYYYPIEAVNQLVNEFSIYKLLAKQN